MSAGSSTPRATNEASRSYGAPVGTASLPDRADSIQRFFELALLGMAASGFFAILGSGELDWPSAGITAAALVLRLAMVLGWTRVSTSSPAVLRLVSAATIGYIVFAPLDYLFVSRSFLPVVVHTILFVAVVKIVTAASPRDHSYVKVIAILEMLAAAILSTSMSFVVCLVAFVMFAIATFTSGEVLRSGRQLLEGHSARQAISRGGVAGFPRRLSLLTGGLFAGILMLTAGMFFVLPRTARAALQRFVPERYHLPGFSNEVTLGEIGAIKQNTTPVMHIRPYDGQGFLPVRWRGAALTNFDGTRWFNPRAPEERLNVENGQFFLDQVRHARPGRRLQYEVQLAEIASDTLFFAGTPETISIDVRTLWRSETGSLRAPRFGRRELRYGAYSFLEDERARPVEPPVPLTRFERASLLDLPALDPRIEQLARDWSRDYVTQEEQARVIEYRLRTDYGYTLELLPAAVTDPLGHFLFERKKGHCEYFASAMAVMLRSIGIPARVTTGFLSGVHNPMTGWQIVRASDAHSWVEAWLPGQGWTTFDPTPADPSATGSGAWFQVSLVLDAAQQFWNDWVVGYDFSHQLVLASRMRASGQRMRFAWIEGIGEWFDRASGWLERWGVEIGALAVFGIVALIYGPTWSQWVQARMRLRLAQTGRAGATDATLLYHRMLEVLESRGVQKPPWLTPAEFARTLKDSELALLVGDLTEQYNQVRFGGRPAAAPRIAQILQRIEGHATR